MEQAEVVGEEQAGVGEVEAEEVGGGSCGSGSWGWLKRG